MSWTVFIVVLIGLLFFAAILFLAHEAGKTDGYREWIEREVAINDKLLAQTEKTK